MIAFQFLIVLVSTAGVISISKIYSYNQLGSVNGLSGLKTPFNYISSPPTDIQYSNNGRYLKDFDLSTQNIFSQLTSQDLGIPEVNEQNYEGTQNQGYYSQGFGANSLINEFKGGRFNSNGYINTAGLGSYGQIPIGNNIKFSQPVQSYAPFQTKYTSSPIRVSYPRAVTAANDAPLYPPLQPISSGISAQTPITIGSGSLGVTRLSNGNYAVGSGSIGYGGGAPIVAYRPQIQQQIPVF